MHSRTTLALTAPAKLNLALAVGPPRSDGMHPICSWMVTVDLFDDLDVVRLEDDRLSRYAVLWHADARRRCDIDWSITQDLAVRAHVALERHVGRRLPVQLKLEKRIPIGSGLGGGSSDAAAMLRAVNALFELELSLDELAAVGAGIGADVPFLVRGGSGLVEGVGERLGALPDVPALPVVVVLPDVACETVRVYRAFDELPAIAFRPDAVLSLAGGAGRGAVRPDALFNDLTRAALRVAPSLEPLLARVAAIAGRPAHLTGSGSSLFVVCDDTTHAGHLAAAIERELGVPALALTTHEIEHAACA